jgi:hypothetical protein
MPEMDRASRVVETHVSTLFFLDDVVYKLKKPVSTGFLDFSARQSRQAACHRTGYRDRAAELALFTSSELVQLRCVLDPAEAALRISRRRAAGGDPSDADAAIAIKMAADSEPWVEAKRDRYELGHRSRAALRPSPSGPGRVVMVRRVGPVRVSR